MNKSIKIFLNVIIVILIGIFIFLFVRNYMTNGKVEREIKDLYDLIYVSNDYDLEKIYNKMDTVVSDNAYAIVEIMAKTYLSDVFERILDLNEIIENNKINDVLTINNYKKDGKKFKETLAYLKEAKQQTLNLEAVMLSDLEINTIMSYIVDEDLSDFYITLYGNLEFAKEKNLKENKKKLEEKVNKFINKIEGMEKVLNFLIENSDYWKIDDNMIVFDNTTLSNEYNEMIGSIE